MTDSPNEQGIGSAEHTRTIPRKRTASTVLYTDAEGRVLICEPTYKAVWEAPGGAGEIDESPGDTGAREVQEELGLVLESARLVAVDYVPPMQGRTEGIIFVFDAGHLTAAQTAAITLDPTELRSWMWSTAADRRTLMRPLVADRIESALAAIEAGTTVYLEAGHPVGTKPTE